MHHLPLMISELDERMRDLKNELQSFEGEEYDDSHKKKAVEALKRMENWNLFTDTHEVRDFSIYKCVLYLLLFFMCSFSCCLVSVLLFSLQALNLLCVLKI